MRQGFSDRETLRQWNRQPESEASSGRPACRDENKDLVPGRRTAPCPIEVRNAGAVSLSHVSHACCRAQGPMVRSYHSLGAIACRIP